MVRRRDIWPNNGNGQPLKDVAGGEMGFSQKEPLLCSGELFFIPLKQPRPTSSPSSCLACRGHPNGMVLPLFQPLPMELVPLHGTSCLHRMSLFLISDWPLTSTPGPLQPGKESGRERDRGLRSIAGFSLSHPQFRAFLPGHSVLSKFKHLHTSSSSPLATYGGISFTRTNGYSCKGLISLS